MKTKKQKTKKDKQHEKIIKKLVMATFLFVIILAHFVVYNIVLGKPITLSYAAETIGLTQKITPFNPVADVAPLQPADSPANSKEVTSVKQTRSTDYRIVTEVGKGDQSSAATPIANRVIAKSPIVTFNGTALYPNAEVFLEIHSSSFFTSVMSDSAGRWSWTNYGHPLEDGDHTVEMYNFAPFEISGKRDVFAKKYSFVVAADSANSDASDLDLGDSEYQEKMGDGDLGDKLIGKNAKNVYFFDAILLDKTEYYPSDTLNLQLIFSSLMESAPVAANINYELYNYEDGAVKTSLVSQFSDQAIVSNDNSYLKRINLHNQVVNGNYILKIAAQIGQNTYVQNVKFKVNSQPVIQIGGTVVTQEKFGKALIFDIVGILVLIIIIFILIIFELRRFMVYHEVDGSIFKKQGMISK